MTRRRAWLLVHRVNGLLLAGFLTVVGLTGAALAWRSPLERLCAPRLFALPPHPAGAPRVDPLTVRANVAAAYPWADVDVADLGTVDNQPLEFQLTPRSGTAPPPTLDDEAYADPFTDRVLGARHSADLRQGMVNLVPFIYDLHQFLALGSAGELCLGLVALLWTFDCFVGLYLTFPASRRRVTPGLAPRAARWPRRFLPSLLVRWSSGAFRRLYDLHRAPGLWLWPLLLLFAWTGVAFNLPGVYAPVMRIFGASRPAAESASTCPAALPAAVISGAAYPGTASPNAALPSAALRGSQLDWPQALTHSRQLMQSELRARHVMVSYERFLSYDRSACQWTYRVHSTLDLDRIGNTQITWSAINPSQATFRSPVGTTRTDALTTRLEAIHEAQLGGTPVRLLVTLTGLTTAALSLTGVLLFLRKVRRRPGNRTAQISIGN